MGSGFHFKGSENPISTITSSNRLPPSSARTRYLTATLKRFTGRADLLYIERKEIVELDSLDGY